MTPPTRILLPHLPPELRNEIYAHLSTPSPSSPPLTTGLPLQLKTYSCKHTTLQLAATHTGSTAFLALRQYNFQEAFEYASWLQTNAMELKIGIAFTGRVNTFVPATWAAKTEKHLRKLAKRYAWLGKVVRYDVKILWDPVDGVLKGKRTAAKMVREMVDAVTVLMENGLKKKRGDVNVELVLGHGFAVANVLSYSRFGLAEFLEGVGEETDCRRVTRSVAWQVPMSGKKEVELLKIEEGVVKWAEAARGHFVMRKVVEGRKTLETIVGHVGRGSEEDDISRFVVSELLEECQGRG